MQWAQRHDKGTWLQMYMVPGNWMPFGRQTTEGSPSRTWQAGGGSFLLLPRRMLSAAVVAVNFQPQHMWKPPGRSSRSCYQFSLPATSFKTRGCVYSSCVWSPMLHASETWPLTKPNLQLLQRNDRAMIRSAMLSHKTLLPPDPMSYLTWHWGSGLHSEGEKAQYGHVECSNGAVKTAFDIQADGKRGPGRPKMTWKLLTERDCREWKLSVIEPHDRHTWRSGARSAMHAASQLPGRGPTDVNAAPVPAR